MMKFLKLLLIVSSLLTIGTSANATLITQADFNEQLSLPVLVGLDVREFESLAVAVGSGVELDDSDEVSNPMGFSGHVDMDLAESGLLTLTSREPSGFADYQLAIFSLSNIMFDSTASIAGVNIIGLGNELFSNSVNFISPIPEVIFGNNSVTITYDVGTSINIADEFNFSEGLSAQFQLVFDDSVDVQVSEPGTFVMLVLSLIALLVRRSNFN